MKTLKFMLAAATAIGLASATQAERLPGASTGFEKLPVGTDVVTGLTDDQQVGDSYFLYAGADSNDNESKIAAASDYSALPASRPRGAAEVDVGRDKVLQVSTGKDPLVRTVNSGGTAQSVTVPVYVDTLVQFTVTPYTDKVTPSDNVDKLMIYLKEMTNSVSGAVEGTNLVVVGGYLTNGDTEPREYVLNTGTVGEVHPNEWHRLTVKAVPDLAVVAGESYGFPGFQIWLDGVLCQLANGQSTYDPNGSGEWFDAINGSDLNQSQEIDNGYYVLSLLAGGGSQTATLMGVGFAGEGVVDDLVITTSDPNANPLDFTFGATSGAFSSVWFTINGGESVTEPGTYQVYPGDTIIAGSKLNEDYTAAPATVVGLTDVGGGEYTVQEVAAASLFLNASANVYISSIALNTNALSMTVGETNTLVASCLPIVHDDSVVWESSNTGYATVDQNGQVIAVGAGTATITAKSSHNSSVSASCTVTVAAAGASDWVDPGTITPSATAAETYPTLDGTPLATANAQKLTTWATTYSVNFSTVSGDTGTALTEAYLLNCDPANLETAKENFKATITVNADGSISVTAPLGYNVTPQLQGKEALDDAEWTDLSEPTDGYRFYRFELGL